MADTSRWRTTSRSSKYTNPIPGTPLRIDWISIRPDDLDDGRSTWVMSPVTTIFELNPSRVRNIFICSVVAFCASSRMMKASLSVRPRMYARGAISIAPFSVRPWTFSESNMSRSEEHTSELQSQSNLVCRLLLEKKKYNVIYLSSYSSPHGH